MQLPLPGAISALRQRPFEMQASVGEQQALAWFKDVGLHGVSQGASFPFGR